MQFVSYIGLSRGNGAAASASAPKVDPRRLHVCVERFGLPPDDGTDSRAGPGARVKEHQALLYLTEETSE